MGKQYKKDFLIEVIVKVDFLISLKSIEKKIPKNLNDVISNYFKISEPQKIIGQELQFSQKDFKQYTKELIEWKYFDKNREKQFVLNPDFALIDYKKHEPYENLKLAFLDILKQLFITEHDVQIKRFGLRYINNIELNENNLTNWEKYIDKNLLSVLNFYEDKKVLARALNHLEFNFEDLIFKFQSGMRNPDYPAPIRRKLFVLDFDCFSEGLINDIGDLESKMDKSHELIVKMFEKSITKEFRSQMNE